MTVSFIVPVYNGKPYLKDCVESLLNQGLDEGSYEIILINDGSTDGSYELCLELAECHRCIKVINQENKGLSEARNSGIRAALGTWICFVDADDELVPDSLSSLITYCEYPNDIIRYWLYIQMSNSREVVDNGSESPYFEGKGMDYLRMYGLETFCVNYLYRKSFILDHNLFFLPGAVGEDFLFMFDVMIADPYITAFAKSIYLYKIHPSSLSTTRSRDNSRLWVAYLMEAMSVITDRLCMYKDSDTVLYNRCRKSLDDKTIALFSRILTSVYTVSEFRDVIAACREKGILPFYHKPSDKFSRLYRSSVNLLISYPSLYPVASRLYFTYKKIHNQRLWKRPTP